MEVRTTGFIFHYCCHMLSYRGRRQQFSGLDNGILSPCSECCTHMRFLSYGMRRFHGLEQIISTCSYKPTCKRLNKNFVLKSIFKCNISVVREDSYIWSSLSFFYLRIQNNIEHNEFYCLAGTFLERARTIRIIKMWHRVLSFVCKRYPTQKLHCRSIRSHSFVTSTLTECGRTFECAKSIMHVCRFRFYPLPLCDMNGIDYKIKTVWFRMSFFACTRHGRMKKE